jgi:hypothetical protein
MPKKNINNEGRVLRLVIAIVLFVLAYWYHSWILAAFGLFSLAQAYFSWCIVYQLLGKNSCPIDINKPKT